MSKKNMFILMFLFLMSIIIASTFSFYAPRIVDETTQLNTSFLSNETLEINYVGGSNIIIDNNQTSIVKTITIKNYGSTQKYYILNLEDVTNNVLDKTKLTYSYTCTGVGCLNQDNTQIPNNNFSLTSIRTIIKNTTQTYTITFIYNGTPTGEFSDRLNVANTKNTLIASTRQYDSRYFSGQKANITSITFEDKIDVPIGVTSWDVSNYADGSVMAYIIDDGLGTGTYKLYIQAKGIILANQNSSYLFYNFPKLTHINNIELLNTSYITNMLGMFQNCINLTILNLSTFNTSNVITMQNMFIECNNLAELDLSNFDTSKVVIFTGMFSYCNNLTSITFNSSFLTADNAYMAQMFYNCTSLINLDVSSFDTSSVTTMDGMFSDCSSLTSLDFRLADFTTVTTYTNMFSYITSGITITVLDSAAQTFINARLTNAVKTGTVVIA